MTSGTLAGADWYTNQRPAGGALSDYGTAERGEVQPKYDAGVVAMSRPKPSEILTWSFFQVVVAGLGAIILTLIGIIYLGIKDDISELKTSTKETTKEVAAFRLETSKALTETNASLRAFTDELRRRR
ncbi:MAG: hypothetical protein ACJ8CQ_14250 [Microvirga sp.]